MTWRQDAAKITAEILPERKVRFETRLELWAWTRMAIQRLHVLSSQLTLCKRKGVGVLIVNLQLHEDGRALIWHLATGINGPSLGGDSCKNVVGGCGCSHAEPRALMARNELSGIYCTDYDLPIVLICPYSPCTNCANAIVDDGATTHIIYGEKTQHDLRGLDILNEASSIEVYPIESDWHLV